MIPGRIDHTAIAVRDLDQAIQRYTRLFGATLSHRSTIAEQRVEVAFLAFADARLELLQPLDEESSVARFLDRRGEGLHHIALAVDDIEAELDRVAALGGELIDRRPRRGAHGRVAFVHPRTTGGVLVELLERDAGPSPY